MNSDTDFQNALQTQIQTLDATAIEDMARTRGWGEFLKFLQGMEKDLFELLFQGGYKDDDVIRGRIDMLRTIQYWPEVVAKQASYGKNLTIDESKDAC